MNKIIIDDEMINEYQKKSLNQLKDIFDELNIMKKNIDDLEWEGESSNVFKQMYNDKINDYFKYARKMVLLLGFTDKITGYYNNATEEIIDEEKKVLTGEIYGENSR